MAEIGTASIVNKLTSTAAAIAAAKNAHAEAAAAVYAQGGSSRPPTPTVGGTATGAGRA